MDTVWRMAAVALAAAAIVALLKKTSPDMAFLLVLAVCCGTIGVFAKYAADITAQFRQGISAVGLPEELFLPLVKTVAIAVLTKTAGDICRDSGENSIGNLVETAGAFAAIVLSLPLFTAAWELLQELL